MVKGMLQGKQKRPLTRTESLIAGAGAGACEAIVAVTPMETIKVKFIHDLWSPSPKYKGFFHGVREIVKEAGFSGIYKGLVPTILKQSSNQAIRFVVYNEITGWMRKGRDSNLTPFHTLFAGALAGAASVFGNTPIDVVKTRMQSLEAQKYKGTWDCIKTIAKHEGLKAFYKGTTPRLVRVCLDVALTFTLYEAISNFLNRIW